MLLNVQYVSRGARLVHRRRRNCPARAWNNHLGVHSLVYVGDWSQDSCKLAISGAKEAGYDFVEISVADPASVDAGMTKEILAEHGMSAATSLGLQVDKDINNEDPTIVRAGLDLLQSALLKTHAMGAKYLVGVIYSALHKYPGPCSAAARANVVRSLKELAAQAQDLGVMLGLEVVNRYETNVCNTAQEGMQLLADVDSPALMIHLDTYHMNIEENSMMEAIETCGDKLGYVHLGESHRGYLGTGSVNFAEAFEGLKKTGYSGPMTFESFSSKVVSPELSNALCVWRNMWSDSQDLAQEAHDYITSLQERTH